MNAETRSKRGRSREGPVYFRFFSATLLPLCVSAFPVPPPRPSVSPCLLFHPLLAHSLPKRRQQLPVRRDQFVHEGRDLVEVEFRCGVRVEERGVVDVLALAGQRRLHRQ